MTVPFPLVFSDPDDVRARLAALGLELDVLQECILDAIISRASCTDNDPPSFPSITMWAVLTRALRLRFGQAGWVKSDRGNFSTIVNPSRTMAIVVSTGNEGTGDKTVELPNTKYPKGPYTEAAVTINKAQLDLFIPTQPITSDTTTKEPLTWILLVRAMGTDFFAELSLPLIIGEDGYIEKWRERILVPRANEERGPNVGRRRPPEPGPDIEVAVVRRAG